MSRWTHRAADAVMFAFGLGMLASLTAAVFTLHEWPFRCLVAGCALGTAWALAGVVRFHRHP